MSMKDGEYKAVTSKLNPLGYDHDHPFPGSIVK